MLSVYRTLIVLPGRRSCNLRGAENRIVGSRDLDVHAQTSLDRAPRPPIIQFIVCTNTYRSPFSLLHTVSCGMLQKLGFCVCWKCMNSRRSVCLSPFPVASLLSPLWSAQSCKPQATSSSAWQALLLSQAAATHEVGCFRSLAAGQPSSLAIKQPPLTCTPCRCCLCCCCPHTHTPGLGEMPLVARPTQHHHQQQRESACIQQCCSAAFAGSMHTLRPPLALTMVCLVCCFGVRAESTHIVRQLT